MTTSFSLQPADVAVVYRGEKLPATGRIWAEHDGRAFPAKDWDDFVVVVLASFCEALARVAKGDPLWQEVHFMEGPHRVRLHGRGRGLRLEFLSEGRLVGSIDDADLSDVAAPVLERARKVERDLRSFPKTRDSVALIEGLRVLEETLRDFPRKSHRRSFE